MSDLCIPDLTVEQLATREREQEQHRRRGHFVETEHIWSKWNDYYPKEEKLPRAVLHIRIRVDSTEIDVDMSVPELRYALDVLSHRDCFEEYRLPRGLANKTIQLEGHHSYERVGLVTGGVWRELPVQVEWNHWDLGDYDEAGAWHDKPDYDYPSFQVRAGYRLCVTLPKSIGEEFVHHLEEQLKEAQS